MSQVCTSEAGNTRSTPGITGLRIGRIGLGCSLPWKRESVNQGPEQRRRIRRRQTLTGAAPGIGEARFPRLKRLADFNPDPIPGIAAQLATLATGAWIDAGQPLVLLGDVSHG